MLLQSTYSLALPPALSLPLHPSYVARLAYTPQTHTQRPAPSTEAHPKYIPVAKSSGSWASASCGRLAAARERASGQIAANTRTRLQEERSSGSRALPGRDTSRNAQHFAAASKALYHTTVHAHARVKRSNLPQLLIYTHGGYVSARWARRLARRRFLARDGWTPHARTAWQACNSVWRQTEYFASIWFFLDPLSVFLSSFLFLIGLFLDRSGFCVSFWIGLTGKS